MNAPLVYLAAPYSNPDPVANTHKVVQTATAMVEAGIVTPVVPHLSLLWHAITPRPVEFWYAYDLLLLARCDAVLRFPGASTGADAEVAEAERLDIRVFTNVDHLYSWAGTQ